MAQKNIALIVGTRPEAIKMSPIYVAALERPEVSVTVLLTGQHDDSMTGVLADFGIASRDIVQLRPFSPGKSLSDAAQEIFSAVTAALMDSRFDVVLVQGDTISAHQGALAAFLLGVPIGHVEAGLRTDNHIAPFPEEGLRRAIAGFARWHFAPSTLAADALRLVSAPSQEVVETGNTIVDAVRILEAHNQIPAKRGEQLVTVTMHRRENLGQNLERFAAILSRLSQAFPNLTFRWFLHPNPEIRRRVSPLLCELSNVVLESPAGYLDMLGYLKASRVILTDSGGIQEECLALNRPILILRGETERPEVIWSGLGELVGVDEEKICDGFQRALDKNVVVPDVTNPYGDGHAASRIVSKILAT